MRKKIVAVILLIVIVFFGALHIYRDKKITTIDFININKLSDKFMNNYFTEVKKMTSNELDNALIVISKKKIKDVYGARKAIPAPNNQTILIYDDSNNRDKALAKLKEDKNVLSVDKNEKYELFNDSNSTSPSSYNSWGVEKMGLDKLIEEVEKTNPEQVNVAVLDSGCDLELFNKYFSGKSNESYNAFNDEAMNDTNGHGTHIAGTIAEATSNNVNIIPVKHTDGNFMDLIYSVMAINWIVYNNKADVINMSFGGSVYSDSLYQAIEAANENNIISVAAAGNENVIVPSYPAGFDNTISVASVNSDFEKAPTSNYGATVTFAAPGERIKSIMNSSTTISKNNIVSGRDDHDDDFETISGTSMATPHVVSAVALLKSINKDLTLDEIVEILKDHTVDLGEDSWDQYFGYGFINFSTAKLCDGNNCDDSGIFDKENNSMIKRIDAGEDVYDSLYNFGNLTNLLNMKMKIYYSDTEYITKDLGELEDLTITGYDPYVGGLQDITIEYKGLTTTKKVNNSLTDGWTYRDYNEGTIDLSSMVPQENYPKYIEIPQTYKGMEIENVSGIVFANKTDIKKVKISANIKYIEFQTFQSCENLISVDLPDSVTSIGFSAFYGTKSLQFIDLPASLESIDENAFMDSGLLEITIPGGVKTIPENTFSGCNNLTSVVLEEGVEEIKSKAFNSNWNLIDITIPKTVTKIENNAFANCDKMNNIVIDEENPNYECLSGSNTIVDKNSNILLFANKYSIIPETIETVGPYAINVSASYDYKLPETIKTLKNNAVYNSQFVTFPKSINSVESTAAFDRESGSVILNLVYEDSFVHHYLEDNNLPYNFIESEHISINNNDTYKAFEKIGEVDLAVSFIFDGSTEYVIGGSAGTTQNYVITYQHGSSFRYGDEYFTLDIDSPITGKHYSEKVYITVEKITPEYDIPTNVSGSLGQKLSEVKLPEGFEWMDGNQSLDKIGTTTYKARYVPDDENYETVENIDIEVSVVGSKTVIVPVITVANKVYDGNVDIDSAKISVSNLINTEYSIVSATSSSVDVGQRTATIKLRLTDDKFADYSFEGGLQEKDFVVDFEIVKADINLTDLSKDVHVVYDKGEHSIDFNITSSSDITIKFMDDSNEYTLDDVPKYTELGTYVTKYKVSIDNNYNDYYGQKTLFIEDNFSYSIENYTVDESNKYISKVMVDTELDDFTSNITLGTNYEVIVDYKEINSKKLIYTGGKTKITKNDTLYREFTNIVMGDINGDGKVDNLDLSKTKEHLMKTDLLEGAYLVSSDINYDNKTNSADLLRLKLHLLGKKPIG